MEQRVQRRTASANVRHRAISYRDRQTGGLVTEQVASERLLRWFYEDPIGFVLFDRYLNSARSNRLIGRWMRHPISRRSIARFVERHGIDLSDAALSIEQYPNFNAFFARQLKADARPFNLQPERFCAPADGKVLVYADYAGQEDLPVKGAMVAKQALLGSGVDAAPYAGGAALVLRLAPSDYHRFHMPDDARADPARLIPGRYHSVSPIALARLPTLYSTNTRAVTLLHTWMFGQIAYIEVGAFAVGSIVQTYTPGVVRRGQEKGYFQFGGSTIVLLFEPGRIQFDDDLARDGVAQLEVQIRAGAAIGSAPRP